MIYNRHRNSPLEHFTVAAELSDDRITMSSVSFTIHIVPFSEGPRTWVTFDCRMYSVEVDALKDVLLCGVQR